MIDAAVGTTLRPLESIDLGAPLALQFADALNGKIVGDGLSLSVRLADRPEQRLPRIEVAPTLSGTFLLRNLPGRLSVELGGAPQAAPAVVVEVSDAQRRFLSFRLRIDSLATGLQRWTDEQGNAVPFPLFSAPSRAVPAAVAVLRAQVHESPAPGVIGPPAAWAVIEASVGGRRLGRGATDEKGDLALLLPYPEALSDPTPGAPPGALLALALQEWRLELKAFYGKVERPPLDGSEPKSPRLEALLAQPAVRLWDDLQHDHPLTQATLRYGRALVIETKQAEGKQLLISPTP